MSKLDQIKMLGDAKRASHAVPIAKSESKQGVAATRSQAPSGYKTTESRLTVGRTTEAAGQSAITPAAPIRRGRPRIGEKREKPWLTANPPMSERTWRRRQAEKAKK